VVSRSRIEAIRARIGYWLDLRQPSETAVLLATAVLVGLGTGLGAVLFIELIALIQRMIFGGLSGSLSAWGRLPLIVAPALGGLLAGPIIAYFAREAKGHGVPEVMAAIALRGGRIRPRLAVAKIVASALCIGSGGSAGREGPIVQVGAALGSTVGQLLGLSEARIKNLVACGAAAGIAATFNAPIAGVIFAMEIILGELHMGFLGNVVLSAVTASTVARVFLGDHPAFSIPEYTVRSPVEILLYALLGLLAAPMGIAFIRVLYWFEDRFDSWRFPLALKPAVGGLMLGVLAFAYPLLLQAIKVSDADSGAGLPLLSHLPQVFGSGFAAIQQMLLGELPLVVLVALVILKPLATSLTLGSGNSGGVFAPSLFIGAALGGAFGAAIESFAPGATAGPGAFAAVGMAAVFAGAARAPFTAILIVFEMTSDYYLIVPLMASVIVSYILAEHLHPESIYTLKLTRRGIRLQRGRDVDVLETVRVEEVMVKTPATVPADLPVSRLIAEFVRTGRHGFPVLDSNGRLAGMVSLEDYRRAAESVTPDVLEKMVVANIATSDVTSVFPDDTVGAALRRMAPRDLGRLPVVARTDPQKLLGVVRRNDILRAHELGVVRRFEARAYADQTQLSSNRDTRFIELVITPESAAANNTVADLDVPRDTVIVSVRRGSQVLIPRGDTRLQVGDVVIALCKSNSADAFCAALASAPESPVVVTRGDLPGTPNDKSEPPPHGG
jgi:CIC family chloride channel protein